MHGCDASGRRCGPTHHTREGKASVTSLTRAARDLLTAIRDPIDAPRPAEYANEQLFAELQRNRVVSALGTIDAVLADEDCPGCTEAAAQILREQTTKQPVTYRPYEGATASKP